jgi:hypothetical protein
LIQNTINFEYSSYLSPCCLFAGKHYEEKYWDRFIRNPYAKFVAEFDGRKNAIGIIV